MKQRTILWTMLGAALIFLSAGRAAAAQALANDLLPQSAARFQQVGAHKNPTLAAALSLVIPGTGQFYNGQAGKGMLHLGLAVAASSVAVIGFASTSCAGYYESYFDRYLNAYNGRWVAGESCAMGYAGLAAAAGVRLWSLLDASASSKRINRQSPVASVHVEPWFGGGNIASGRGTQPGVRVGVELRTLALFH